MTRGTIGTHTVQYACQHHQLTNSRDLTKMNLSPNNIQVEDEILTFTILAYFRLIHPLKYAPAGLVGANLQTYLNNQQ